MKEIKVELLIGKQVIDSDGRKVGRIHEIRAERGEESCPVEAYYVGTRAMLIRVAQWAVPQQMSSYLESRILKPFRINWDQMDLSDPERPRLKCRVDDLK